MPESTPPSRSTDQALQALAVASHEVRGGLAGIIAHARLLEEPGLCAKRRASAARVIERNGLHLLELFDRILQSARTDAGPDPLRPEPGDLRMVIAESVDLFRAAAAERGVHLDWHAEPAVPDSVRFDQLAVRRILGNLIGNAVKFTTDGSIRVLADCTNDDRVRIEVVDTGCGIAPGDHDRIFEPFQRADPAVDGACGVGLGLALCRRLASMMDGTLALESAPGSGATFRIEWPLDRWNAADQTDLSGIRLLLVDDCADTRALVEPLLTTRGVRVSTAVDGRAALDHLGAGGREHRFDVVLLDLEMPGMNGWEAAAEMRRIGFRGPVIALSAHQSSIHHHRALQAGCTTCLSKPISLESLTGTLSSQLSHRSARLAG